MAGECSGDISPLRIFMIGLICLRDISLLLGNVSGWLLCLLDVDAVQVRLAGLHMLQTDVDESIEGSLGKIQHCVAAMVNNQQNTLSNINFGGRHQ